MYPTFSQENSLSLNYQWKTDFFLKNYVFVYYNIALFYWNFSSFSITLIIKLWFFLQNSVFFLKNYSFLFLNIGPRCWDKAIMETLPKESFVNKLESCDWNIIETKPPKIWNRIENNVIRVVDKVAPLTGFINNSVVNSINTPANQNKKQTTEKDWRRKWGEPQQNKTELIQRIKNLNCEIRNNYRMEKGKRVRRNMTPGPNIKNKKMYFF